MTNDKKWLVVRISQNGGWSETLVASEVGVTANGDLLGFTDINGIKGERIPRWAIARGAWVDVQMEDEA